MDIAFQNDVIRFPGRFDSPDLERDYRASLDLLMVQRMFVFLLIVLAANVILVFSDISLAISAPFLAVVLTARAANVLGIFAAFLVLRRPAFAAQAHWIVFAALFMTAIQSGIVTFSRPPDYAAPVVATSVIVLVFYVALPIPLLLKVVPGAIVSAASWFKVIVIPENPDPNAVRIAVIAHILIHSLGIYMSIQEHYTRRREFSLATRQNTLIRELNEAMRQIKTLRGIVPICAHCKDIRDEQGNWSSIETYLTRNTHGQLTHGICPGCLKKHYPEYAEGV